MEEFTEAEGKEVQGLLVKTRCPAIYRSRFIDRRELQALTPGFSAFYSFAVAQPL